MCLRITRMTFLVFILILFTWWHAKAQTQHAKPAALCFNPNRRLGTCLSIYNCPTLKYLLEHKFRLHYGFVRASQCANGSGGSAPFVCCTQDFKYDEKISTRSRSERIVFPDEIERDKRTKLKLVETTSTASSTTEKQTTDGLIDQVFNETSETSTELALEKLSKFPKPPNCGGVIFSNKIYGGKDAELGEFSWMVILEFRNLTTGKIILDCSGSIINERYILTAAHCVQGEILKVNGRLDFVRIGEHNTETEIDCNEMQCQPAYQRIKIEAIIPHEDYSTKSYDGARNRHDIALLRLEKPIKFDENIEPVCLPFGENFEDHAVGTKFVVSGWGHNGLRARTPIKQKVELPFIMHAECRQKFATKFNLSKEQLCAGGRFREDSCSGDSGGPLMRLSDDFWLLEGIVSFGIRCGLESPAIYTNVRHYLNWIEDHVKNV